MSWKGQKAIKRIYNTFKRLNKQIFSEDVQALKDINEVLETFENHSVRDSHLFMKLLVVHLVQNISYYGSIKLALKKVDDDLKKTLDCHLSFLTSELNRIDLNNFLNEKGINTHYNDKTYLNQIKQHEKEIIEKISKSWEEENVKKSLIRSAGDFLKDLNNYA